MASGAHRGRQFRPGDGRQQLPGNNGLLKRTTATATARNGHGDGGLDLDRLVLNNGIEFRRAERTRWSLPNKELQLTSGTCCGRVEPLRGTTRWL